MKKDCERVERQCKGEKVKRWKEGKQGRVKTYEGNESGGGDGIVYIQERGYSVRGTESVLKEESLGRGEGVTKNQKEGKAGL